MHVAFMLLGAVAAATASGQPPVALSEVLVHSPRVSNQSPAGTFAMPVSALRYEPRADIHARNLAEGQADVTVRGGIFENTGFQVGALTLLDPQTGHYLAEIPVAPAMLTAPELRTGIDLAAGATNATAGAIAQGWREIKTAGALSLGAGEHSLRRGEFYQGVAPSQTLGGLRVGADVAVAHSKSDGAVPFGEHEFNRVNGRLQLRGAASQTDLFAGYQAKFFGWPNMYTPFNSNETEDLETVLLVANHRVTLGAGEFVEAGVFHRRNKDDYAFNRFAAVPAIHPFQHTTWLTGAAVGGRVAAGGLAWNFRGEVLADEIKSTSLTFGPYRTRTLTKLALIPEKSWSAATGGRWIAKAGATLDESSRDSAAWSPVFELAREFQGAGVSRVYFSATRTTQLPTYTALKSSTASGLFRGNSTLGRQRSDSVELGLAGNLANWQTNAAAFFRKDDGLVDWTFRRGVTARSANPVDIDVFGFEAVARRSWSALDLVFGYTWLDKDPSYRGAVVDASFYALNYAEHRLTAAFTMRVGREWELRLDNVARIQADNMLRTVGGDRALTSALALAYRPTALRRCEFTLQLDNAWDDDFQDVPAVPAAPRQFSAGVSYAW